jgi:hypothetical protein
MHSRVLAAVFAVCLSATAQSLTVNKLVQFIQSCTAPEAKGKYTDKQIADYLQHVKLTERLDDRTIEQLEGMGIGPKTIQALHVLRDRTQALVAAAPPEALLPPKPIPPPSSEEQAAIISEVRDYALNYSKSLPDFICTQVTKRFAAYRPGTKYGGRADEEPRWQAQDELTYRLSFFNQKEDYKLILHNSTPTVQDSASVGGTSSYGDFGTMLLKIFEPNTETRFEWDHWGTLRGKRVMAFHYRVSKERSSYHIIVPDAKLDIITAYNGLVEVDKDNHLVMRVTLEAENLPADFPIKSAKTILDYDYVEISGQTFLLPLKGQVFGSDSSIVTRNDTTYHNYRKYSAESVISFGDEATPPPISDDKTKETIDPGQKPADQNQKTDPTKKKQD